MPKRTIKNKTVEVILLQQDRYLWEKYEVVRVRPSYARNVLFPKNIAVFADSMMLNQYAQKMKAADGERAKKAKSIEDLFAKVIEDWGLNIERKANKEWGLYDKIDENDIVKMIAAKYGIEIDSHLFKLKKKIVAVGSYQVPFLYKEMKKDLQLNVAAEKAAHATAEKVEGEQTEEVDLSTNVGEKKPVAKKAPAKKAPAKK